MNSDHTQAEQDKDANNQELASALARFKTFRDLHRSETYRRHRDELHRLLDEPKIYPSAGARPRLKNFLRVVAWNIERGSRLEGIIEALNHHPVLRYGDLLLLSELDNGMVRSGNRNVAREIGRAISAHSIYGVEYLEMTKGPASEQHLSGSNTTALHGNAIVTRHDYSNVQMVNLPRCENNFESAEKRLGGRKGLLTDLKINGANFLAATVHLDVVNTPRCRASQMRALLDAIDARISTSTINSTDSTPVIIGGDLNTHTFARGGRVRAIRNTLVVLGSNPDRLARRLLNPQARENALQQLARSGYETSGLNDKQATSRAIVSGLDDRTRLPALMKSWANSRVPPEGLVLEFRLDWLAGRNIRPLAEGEIIDAETGEASLNPHTIHGLAHAGLPLSDHDPIVVDIAVDR